MSNNPLPTLIRVFLDDARERVARIRTALQEWGTVSEADRSTLYNEIVRQFHTLKGDSGMINLVELQHVAGGIEAALDDGNPDDFDMAALEPSIDQIETILNDLQNGGGSTG